MRVKLLAILLMLVSGLVVSKALAGEDDIRQAFTALQKAIKGRDADKIWGLIDSDSQADANRAAKAVQAAFAKADDKGKGEFEKKYGLTAKELGAMSGKLFLKSERFHGKYHEVPGSKLETVKVLKGDTARITYKEEDGDIEKFSMVKQKGEWKFTVPMPKAVE
jgi:hypothetical protein